MTEAEWAAWSSAVAALLTFLIYVVLAFYAKSQINEAKKLRANQAADADRRAEEARELRRQQARPFVVAEMVPDFIITFRVRNVGQTLARNVRITWDVFPSVTGNFANDPGGRTPTPLCCSAMASPSCRPARKSRPCSTTSPIASPKALACSSR